MNPFLLPVFHCIPTEHTAQLITSFTLTQVGAKFYFPMRNWRMRYRELRFSLAWLPRQTALIIHNFTCWPLLAPEVPCGPKITMMLTSSPPLLFVTAAILMGTAASAKASNIRASVKSRSCLATSHARIWPFWWMDNSSSLNFTLTLVVSITGIGELDLSGQHPGMRDFRDGSGDLAVMLQKPFRHIFIYALRFRGRRESLWFNAPQANTKSGLEWYITLSLHK